jgi:hypothetical protein
MCVKQKCNNKEVEATRPCTGKPDDQHTLRPKSLDLTARIRLESHIQIQPVQSIHTSIHFPTPHPKITSPHNTQPQTPPPSSSASALCPHPAHRF